MADILHDTFATQGFMLGQPVLVCRWRLAAGKLPLASRHLRALSKRFIDGAQLPRSLVAWAKQHIDRTLAEGTARWPEGTLMLVVDTGGQAAMTTGPYEPLPAMRLDELVKRAAAAQKEARATHVAPETLWLVERDQLVWGIERDEAPSGSASLVADLARTLGMNVVHRAGLVRSVAEGSQPVHQAFLVSDEHGVVLPCDVGGPEAERFAASYRKLFVSTKR